jgi:hypothetical protein
MPYRMLFETIKKDITFFIDTFNKKKYPEEQWEEKNSESFLLYARLAKNSNVFEEYKLFISNIFLCLCD